VPSTQAHEPHRADYSKVTVTLSSFLSEGAQSEGKMSGQGVMKFRVLHTASELPQAALKVLTSAHGGFGVDTRPGKGETYFALPGAGILQVSADLQTVKLIDTPPEITKTNMHSATVWYAPDGTPYLVFAANDDGKIFTTTLDGKLVSTLSAPTVDDDLDNPTVNNYFAGGGSFVPTGVTELDGRYYMSTGYSFLDYVLTARISSYNPFTLAWNDLVFGGRGDAVGQFNQAHAIQVHPGTKHLEIADRMHSKVDLYTRYGHYLSSIRVPDGALPCDVHFCDIYTIIPCLEGPDRRKGGPIYILRDGKIISTVYAKDDLGLENFKHIHNAVLRKLGSRFYIIAQAWNPGDFAILEQVNP
jgi:hypothetical protein